MASDWNVSFPLGSLCQYLSHDTTWLIPTQVLLSQGDSLSAESLYVVQEGCFFINWSSVEVQVWVMLRQMASLSCLGNHSFRVHGQIFITIRHWCVCYCGCPFWHEDRSVVHNCCWSSPVQSFSSLSTVGLMTIFYCPRFETPPPPTWRGRSPYF
jgi:hypothetical protein